MIRILGTIFAGVLGLVFGSFLNVFLTRWPSGESIVSPRSHCRQCGRTLAWWENVPLVSWLALRGRCRTCRAWIGWRYPVVELAVGGLWIAATFRSFGDLQYAVSSEGMMKDFYFSFIDSLPLLVFYWILIALTVLDLEEFWLPDVLTIPGCLIGIAFNVVRIFLFCRNDADCGSAFPFSVSIAGMALPRTQLADREPILWLSLQWLIGVFLAAALILLIRWIYGLVRHREGMGLGDVKLMAMLAAWLGLPGALLALGLGAIIGTLLIAVLAMLLSTRREEPWASRKEPFGAFICIGGIISSLWGKQMIEAYLRWAGF